MISCYLPGGDFSSMGVVCRRGANSWKPITQGRREVHKGELGRKVGKIVYIRQINCATLKLYLQTT